MKNLKKFLNYKAVILIMTCMFMGAGVCTGEPAVEDVDHPQLEMINATIMEIDLAAKMFVVAEKEIHLLTKVKNNQLVWKTIFSDQSGKAIPVTSLKIGDRVIIKIVELDSGRLNAESVTFVNSMEPGTTQSVSRPNQSQPLQLQEGVWKN